MNKLIKSENAMAVVVVLFIYFFVFHYSFLLLIGLLLVPDLSAIGYIVNTRIGAITYNTFHHLVLPSIVLVVSIFFNLNLGIAISLIWFLHIFADRALGFGLKYPDDFKHTHLS